MAKREENAAVREATARRASCDQRREGVHDKIFTTSSSASKESLSLARSDGTMACGAATSTFTVPRATYAPGARRVRRARRTVARASAVETAFHALPDGLKLEVQSMSSKQLTSKKPPLVFVHGSYHAAWCWSEHFFEYFASRGHDCYALSMRGQGASDMPRDPEAKVAATLEQHADDVSNFCATLSQPPVLVGHSFGGLIAQRAMVQRTSRVGRPGAPRLGAPHRQRPDGWAFPEARAHRKHQDNLRVHRRRVQIQRRVVPRVFLQRKSPRGDPPQAHGSDRDVVQRAPAGSSIAERFAAAPAPGPRSPPVCVVGGEDDFVVDVEGLEETAEWGKTEAIVLKDTAHDLMLDTRWEGAAAALEGWMEQKL